MLIVGIKDKALGKFIDFIPGNNIVVIKRYLANVVKTPGKSVYFTNTEDFEAYSLCEINEEIGSVSTANCTWLFNLVDLKNEVQVQ